MSRIREKLIAFLYSPAFSAFVIIAILLRFILAALPDAVFLVVQSFSAPDHVAKTEEILFIGLMTIWLVLPGVVYRFRKSIDRIVKSARFLWVGVCLLFLALLSPSDAVSDVWLLQIVNNIEDLLFAGVVLCTIANRKLIVQRSLTLAQTRPVKTLSTLTIIAAITLFLTELTVRVYTHYRPKPEQFFLEYMDLYEVVDPEVGHAMKPNVVATLSGNIAFSPFTVVSSPLPGLPSYGFRNPPSFDYDDLDAILIGDSFAWGYGLEHENTLAALLTQNCDLTTLNLGISGFTTPATQQSVLFKALDLLPRKPKYVIWTIFPFNDLTDQQLFERWQRDTERKPTESLLRRVLGYYVELWKKQAAQSGQPEQTPPEIPATIKKIDRLLAPWSRLYLVLLRNLIIPPLPQASLDLTVAAQDGREIVYRNCPLPGLSEAEQRTYSRILFETMSRAKTRLEEMNIRLISLVIPSMWEYGSPDKSKENPVYVCNAVSEQLIREGQDVVDLYTLWKDEKDVAKKYYFEKDAHFNTDGAKQAAEEICRHLRATQADSPRQK